MPLAICNLQSLKFSEIEIATYPSVVAPFTEDRLNNLFGDGGQGRAFDSLSRQVMSECCKVLLHAGYKPIPAEEKISLSYFQNFLNGVFDLYNGEEINSNLYISPITVLPADDPGNFSDIEEEHRDMKIGYVVYLTMSLWVKSNNKVT